MKRILTMLLSITLAFTIVACSGISPAPAAEYRDTIIYAHNTDVRELDPQRQNDTASEQVVKMIYNTLLDFDDDGTPVGDLAESWEVSDDSLTWTFHLKRGVRFHSGKEMTANDVKATYERALYAQGAALRTTEVIRMFTKIEVPDPYTVVITTDEPYGPMEALMCNMFLGIMCSDTLEEYGLDISQIPEAANGTGPYRLASWVKDSQIVLERFDDYFGERARTQTIIYQVIPEAAARVMALESGEVDSIGVINADDLPLLESNPDITVIRGEGIGQRLFRFGCNDPIMADTKVRQAINIALDRQIIIDSMFNGVAYPVTSALAPATWGYHNWGVIEQDLEKARALLAEAGYPDGFETKIVTTERYAKGVQLAEVLAAQLSEIGIKAEIEVMEWSAISAAWNGLTAEEFDQPIFIMGAGPSMRDADGGLRGLYTTTERYNDRNYGFYSNAEVDELVFAGMRETDMVKRAELYKRAQEILYLEDPAGVWLFNNYNMVAFSNKLEDIQLTGIGNVLFKRAAMRR